MVLVVSVEISIVKLLKRYKNGHRASYYVPVRQTEHHVYYMNQMSARNRVNTREFSRENFYFLACKEQN